MFLQAHARWTWLLSLMGRMGRGHGAIAFSAMMTHISFDPFPSPFECPNTGSYLRGHRTIRVCVRAWFTGMRQAALVAAGLLRY